MRINRARLAVSLALLVLAAGVAAAQDAVVTVTTTEGRVEYQREDGNWRSLVSGRGAPLDSPVTARAEARAAFDVAGVAVEIGPLTALRFLVVTPAAVTVELMSGTLGVTKVEPGTVVTVNLPRGSVISRGATFRIAADQVDGVGAVGVVTATSTLGHSRRVWPGEVVLLASPRPVLFR